MSVAPGMFLSLAAVAAGFSLLRLSLRDGWKEVFDRPARYMRVPCRVAAISLFVLSPYPWLAVAAGPVVGWMAWVFCIVPLAGLPLIAWWPFNRAGALFAPPAMLALCAAVSGI